VTQGAISRHVANLEDYLHTRLFVRHHKRIELTAQGAAYCAKVRRAFQQIDRATSDLVAMRNQMLLKVKLTPTLAFRWFVPRLSRFNTMAPHISVQIATSHEAPDFDRDDIDAAIQFNPHPSRHLVVKRLLGEVLVPVCSPALAARGDGLREPADLRRHVLLHSLQRRADWTHWLAANGVSADIAGSDLWFEDSSLAYESAVSGLGVAIANVAFIGDELKSGRLVLPFGEERRLVTDSSYCLVYPSGSESEPTIRAFNRWLMSEVDAAKHTFG
jgi:LysR family glycine cleavage system transcriptional activator